MSAQVYHSSLGFSVDDHLARTHWHHGHRGTERTMSTLVAFRIGVDSGAAHLCFFRHSLDDADTSPSSEVTYRTVLVDSSRM